MNDAQLQAKLTELLALPQETEWAEFKHNNSDPQMIGEYLSAISNSAALESQPFGYIVWGIENGTHKVVGTSFKPRQQKGQGNEDLEPWLNKLLAPRINFRIFEFKVEGNSMVLFGSGIKRTFQIQRDRNFPMPTYDLTEPERVKVRLIGQILDPNYTRMLMSQANLDLLDVIALDKVQKKQNIGDSELKSLRDKKLVEGRRPNLFVSSAVAAATQAKAEYIRNRAFDKDHYEKMVVTYLEKFGEATRQDLDKLLLPKLSEALDDEQKQNFVMNLLQEMRRLGKIEVVGRGKGARWSLP